MKLHYCSIATLSAEMIKRFLAKIHVQYAPEEPLNYEPTAYARKLSERAEAIVCGLSEVPDLTGGVWGYCNDSSNRIAYISYIAKTKNAPRGLGTQLHEAFRWLAIGRGMRRIHLEVLKSNLHACEFYRTLGYECIEERERSYLMGRSLNAPLDVCRP